MIALIYENTKKNNTRQSINFTLTSEEYEELIATPWVMIIPTWGGRSRSLGREFRSGYNRKKSLKWIQSEQNLSEYKHSQWCQWAKLKKKSNVERWKKETGWVIKWMNERVSERVIVIETLVMNMFNQ